MIWLYAATVAALGFAVNLLISKYVMREVSSLNFSATYCLLGSIFSLPVFLYFALKTGLKIDLTSFLALLVASVANTSALLSINEAVKKGEVSLAYPLSRTEPVFALVLGVFLLNEAFSFLKLGGVLLATSGAYFMMLEGLDFWKPFKKIRGSISAQLGVLSGFFYSLGAIADRFAVQTINPKIYTFLLLFCMAAIYILILFFRKDKFHTEILSEVQDHRLEYFSVSLILIISYYALVKALSLAEASRVVPVLQLEIIVSVIGGYVFYSEENMIRKLIGSALLISGIILVAAPKLI